MAENLLEIQNIRTSIGGKEILHDVSLNIQKGEIHVLMGPNGAGKSTLGYTLMGNPDYQVEGGKIIFDGTDVTELGTDRRAKAGMFLSFQDPLEVVATCAEVGSPIVEIFLEGREWWRCMGGFYGLWFLAASNCSGLPKSNQ